MSTLSSRSPSVQSHPTPRHKNCRIKSAWDINDQIARIVLRARDRGPATELKARRWLERSEQRGGVYFGTSGLYSALLARPCSYDGPPSTADLRWHARQLRHDPGPFQCDGGPDYTDRDCGLDGQSADDWFDLGIEPVIDDPEPFVPTEEDWEEFYRLVPPPQFTDEDADHYRHLGPRC